jgi:RimJ/RimL family protein N-acetyltransferase
VDREARTTGFVLRELRWEDFDARVDAYFALYEEVRTNPDLGMSLLSTRPNRGEETEWFASQYRRVIEGEDIAVVADVGGRAVGLVTIAGPRYGGRQSEKGHVGTLGILVEQGYRGRGIGRALLLRALELAKRRFEVVRLLVFSVNTRAKRLYEEVGFRTTGLLAKEVKRGDRFLDEELMSLDLSTWSPPAETLRS